MSQTQIINEKSSDHLNFKQDFVVFATFSKRVGECLARTNEQRQKNLQEQNS